MGTSSSNGGPKGKTSLMPSWAPAAPAVPAQPTPPPSGSTATSTNVNIPVSTTASQPSNIQTEKWSHAKGGSTRFANKTGKSSAKNAAKSYLKTYGGSRNATKASTKGIMVGAGFAAFLGGVATNGMKKTLKDVGLDDYVGKSSAEVLAKIADTIAPAGATNDEAVAREAIITALDNLYERLLEDGKDISTLDLLSEEMVKETVIEYVSAYIFKKWLYELGIAIEKNNLPETEVIKLESQMDSFIKDEVKSAITDDVIAKIQVKAINNHPIIQKIMELAYSTLE